MLIPEFLKLELDKKLADGFAARPDLNEETRKAIRDMTYGGAQRFIDTHPPGPYPKWGEGHANILAAGCVEGAFRRLRQANGDLNKLTAEWEGDLAGFV